MAPLRSLGNINSAFDDFYARTGKDASSAAPPGAVAPSTPDGVFSVSGGNATSTGGGYKYFYFTSPGNLAVQHSSGSDELAMSFMLIGAGGGGTSTGGGGGGAGAFVQKIDHPVTSVPSSSVNWAVSIGSAVTSPYQSDGNPSTFTISTAPKTFTAAGGGKGTQSSGNTGGSGSGGGRNPPYAGGASTVPQTIDGGNTPDTGIGYAGGNGFQNMPGPAGGTGGGGGGAGGVGSNSPTTTSNPYGKAGKGGLGRAAFNGDTNVSSTYGTPGPSPGRWFAGGGGGGNHTQNTNYGGDAPDGGGGASGSPNTSSGFGGNPVTVNTGGGGGGGGGTSNGFVGAGSAGAPGICIVRISTSNLS